MNRNGIDNNHWLGRASNCNTEAHINVSHYWRDSPPFWTYQGCPSYAFSSEDIRGCLNTRTIYAMGNSVGRQYAFGIKSLLEGNGNNVTREKQKQLCPKISGDWQESCGDTVYGTKIKFLSVAFIDGYNYKKRGGFPFHRFRSSNGTWVTGKLPSPHSNANGHWRGDYNVPATERKFVWADTNTNENYDFEKHFESLTKNSTSDDILIFSVGMAYAFGRQFGVTSTWNWPEKFNDSKSVHIPIDTHAWLLHSAQNFKNYLFRHFRGSIYWVNLADLRRENSTDTDEVNAAIKDINDVLADVFLNVSAIMYKPANESEIYVSNSTKEERRIKVIDQATINTGREHLYEDKIHFNGVLTEAALYQILADVCPIRVNTINTTNIFKM